MSNHSIYTVGGTVHEGIYIKRAADDELLKACQNGTFAYILAPRQVGKSSVMVRTANRLHEVSIQPVIIDLTQIGANVTAEQWYLGVLVTISDQLMIEADVVTWWNDHAHLGFTHRWTRFFREVILKDIPEQIVIFVDEIDTTLSLDFTDDFFAAIRSLNDERARHAELKRLSFVLLGVATPSDLMRDPKRTPFNIGTRIELDDWTLDECSPLAKGLGIQQRNARNVIIWIHGWTHGHPYLTQRLCSMVAQEQRTVWTKSNIDDLVTRTFLGSLSEQDNNIQFVRDMLTKRAPDISSVLTEYRAIHKGRRVVDEAQSLAKTHLKLAGVVRRDNNLLKVRNNLYATIFDQAWIREHLPTNWLRTLRWISIGIIIALPFLLFALYQRNDAIDARATAVVDREKAMNAQRTAEIDRTTARNAEATAIVGQEESVRLRRLAEASALAFQSQQVREISPTLALQLALAAIERNNTPQIQDIVRQADPKVDIHRSYVKFDARDRGVINNALWSKDGRYIALSTRLSRFTVVSFIQDEVIMENVYSGYGRFAFSNDSRIFAYESNTNSIDFFDLSSRKILYSIKRNSENSLDIFWFSPDDKKVVFKTAFSFEIWDLPSKSQIILDEMKFVNSVAFSPDSTNIVVTYSGQKIDIINIYSRKLENTFDDPNSSNDFSTFTGVLDAQFSPDGSKLASTADGSKVIPIWDVKSGKKILELKGHADTVSHVLWNNDGKRLLSWSKDRTVRLWNIDNQTSIELTGHTSSITKSEWSSDGRYVLTLTQDGSLRIWNTQNGMLLSTLRSGKGLIEYATWSPGSTFLLTMEGIQDDTIAYVRYAEFDEVLKIAGQRVSPLTDKQIQEYLFRLDSIQPISTTLPTPTPSLIQIPFIPPTAGGEQRSIDLFTLLGYFSIVTFIIFVCYRIFMTSRSTNR